MRLRESILIFANAQAVWPYLADPVLQADWNPKVVSIERSGTGPVQFGERFRMIYRMSGRDRETQVEVTELQAASRVVFCHRMVGEPDDCVTEEAYDITPIDGEAAVRVVQTIDLGRAGIPWWVRPLIWFIHRFGKRTGEAYLETLRRLVEQPATVK